MVLSQMSSFLPMIHHCSEVSAKDLQDDFNSITEWAHQRKISFNPDPTKPAEEILLSYKKQTLSSTS